MIVWTAECATCPARQRVPDEYRDVKAAKRYAHAWQLQHNLEVHNGDTDETASEEGS